MTHNPTTDNSIKLCDSLSPIFYTRLVFCEIGPTTCRMVKFVHLRFEKLTPSLNCFSSRKKWRLVLLFFYVCFYICSLSFLYLSYVCLQFHFSLRSLCLSVYLSFYFYVNLSVLVCPNYSFFLLCLVCIKFAEIKCNWD